MAEALPSVIIGLLNGYLGVAFTLIMMGIHLHHQRKLGKRE